MTKQYITQIEAVEIYNANKPANARPYRNTRSLAEKIHNHGFGELQEDGYISLTRQDVMDYIQALQKANEVKRKHKRRNDPRLGISEEYLRLLRGECNRPFSPRQVFDDAQMNVLLENDNE